MQSQNKLFAETENELFMKMRRTKALPAKFTEWTVRKVANVMISATACIHILIID